MKKEKLNFFFERTKKDEGIEKEKIQISHLGKEAGVGHNKTWKQY
jgi:hypothetical protein